MTASPTPFAEGSGEMPGSEPGKATHAKTASVQPASAAMPSEGDVARAAYAAMCEGYNSTPRWIDEPAEIKALYRAQARAVLALFAPILAEKERRDAADAKRKEFSKWLDELAENPPPPSEALKKLFADYRASGIKSVGLDSPHNACCYREECRTLEARALAAESALAAVEKPGTYFANQLQHEWIGPDGIRYSPTRERRLEDVEF